MLILILIVLFILLLVIYLVTAIRRHDAESYSDQDRDPFYAESARLAAAGLLYEQDERESGRPRKSYTVTPAGEAALRTWLREPMNDPGMLRLYFAGILGPNDVLTMARQFREGHEQRLQNYTRIQALLSSDAEEWADARKTAALGRRFEEFCVDFWRRQVDSPIRVPAQGDDDAADPPSGP